MEQRSTWNEFKVESATDSSRRVNRKHCTETSFYRISKGKDSRYGEAKIIIKTFIMLTVRSIDTNLI
jgi:hypothetical protein